MAAEFEVSGATAIKRVAQNDPGKFLTLIANLCPKGMELDVKLGFDLAAEANDFARAFRLARAHINGDRPISMIDVTPVDEAEPDEID